MDALNEHFQLLLYDDVLRVEAHENAEFLIEVLELLLEFAHLRVDWLLVLRRILLLINLLHDLRPATIVLLNLLLALNQINRAQHLVGTLRALRPIYSVLIKHLRLLKITDDVVPVEGVEEDGHVAVVVLD